MGVVTSVPGTTVCPGTLVNYTPVYTGGGSSPGFAWTLNGVAVGTSSAYSVVPVTGDVVGVTLTSSDPCA